MRLAISALALAVFVSARDAYAQRQTIDFDNVPAANINEFRQLTGNYAGFSWSTGFNAWALITDGQPHSVSGDPYRPSSGNTNVSFLSTSFNSFSRPGEAFTLNSLYLGAWFDPTRTNNDATIFLYGFFENEQTYSTQILASSLTTDLYQLDWSGVDRIGIAMSSTTNSKIILDDITVTSSPEPATLVLVGSGFVGLVGFVRRRDGMKRR